MTVDQWAQALRARGLSDAVIRLGFASGWVPGVPAGTWWTP